RGRAGARRRAKRAVGDEAAWRTSGSSWAEARRGAVTVALRSVSAAVRAAPHVHGGGVQVEAAVHLVEVAVGVAAAVVGPQHQHRPQQARLDAPAPVGLLRFAARGSHAAELAEVADADAGHRAV